MISSIIDIGSNTIRLSVYQIQEGTIIPLLHKKTMAGLASYIQDGCMSEEGIHIAIRVLKEYRSLLEHLSIQTVSVFATAALREISNTIQAVKMIQKETGFLIDVISGKREAVLDFFGATHVLDTKEGILVDIGGGSTELVSYQNASILQASSMEVGSLGLFARFVGNLFPSKKEQKKISNYVKKQLEKQKEFRENQFPILCGVGGTIRATLKLNNLFFQQPDENKSIPAKNVKKLLKQLNQMEPEVLRKVLKVIPDRIHTIIPGMIVLQTIIKRFGCEEIQVSPYGVREGYLYQKILKEGRMDSPNTKSV